MTDDASGGLPDMDPRRYYDEFGDGEWRRLERDPVGRLEFEGTVGALEDHLPPAGRVLDAGGGPGRYAVWLAERGYAVEHLDLSGEQVRIAREKAAEHGVADAVTCRQGDVRALPFAEGAFDAVCCLGGPLSHVLAPAERETAVRELGRVARDGAPVMVSVIGRLNAVRYGLRHGLEDHPGMLPELAETGDYTAELVAEAGGEGWAECHFFRADEFEALLEAGGLAVEQLVGLEGPASLLGPDLEEAPDAAMSAVREVVASLREDRAVADLSEHILAVARA